MRQIVIMFRQLCAGPSTTFSSARICDTQDLYWPDEKEEKKDEKGEVGSDSTLSTAVEEKPKKKKKTRKKREGGEVLKGEKKERAGTGLFD